MFLGKSRTDTFKSKRDCGANCSGYLAGDGGRFSFPILATTGRCHDAGKGFFKGTRESTEWARTRTGSFTEAGAAQKTIRCSGGPRGGGGGGEYRNWPSADLSTRLWAVPARMPSDPKKKGTTKGGKVRAERGGVTARGGD